MLAGGSEAFLHRTLERHEDWLESTANESVGANRPGEFLHRRGVWSTLAKEAEYGQIAPRLEDAEPRPGSPGRATVIRPIPGLPQRPLEHLTAAATP